MQVQPYLHFDGQAEEAAHFYRDAVGAEIQMLMRFSDSPEPHPPGMVPAGMEQKIMHMSLKIGDSVVMVADGGVCTGKHGFEGFALTLSSDEEADTKKQFNALSEGGQVRMPLTKTFFSPCFGMLTDRFGVSWTVMTNPR